MAGGMSIEAEIAAGLHSFEIERELDKLADEVADFAKSIAPVFGDRPPKRDAPADGAPGDFKNSIKVTPQGPGKRRVGSDDFKAVWAELGTRHMPEYAVFAKTAAHFGGTGPIIDEGIQRAQSHLRRELEHLAKLHAEMPGSFSAAIDKAQRLTAQKRKVEQARTARSAAFNAARPRRRGRRR
ncbi:hypothetical protein E2F47_01910 [Mycobacterium eburneum]|nr:hypothetical protein [Mycobacterium eburneum]TDH57547.1 hypothetical protein E2F47_01910 [Mycobacterium eburneum]